jgi:hypothetical protein
MSPAATRRSPENEVCPPPLDGRIDQQAVKERERRTRAARVQDREDSFMQVLLE